MGGVPVEPQVRAWATEQSHLRSVRWFLLEATSRLAFDDLEEAQKGLEKALESLRRARAAHARWAGK